MNSRRCLGPNCPHHEVSTPCERKQFYYHMKKKTDKEILEIFNHYKIIKFPEKLLPLTRINLLTDLSIEPIASQIIDESKQKKVDS